MTQAIIERIHELVRKNVQGSRDRPTLDPEDKLHALGANDLDLLQMLMDVEDEWDIDVTDDEAESIKAVGDLEALVMGKLDLAEEEAA